MNVSDDPGFPTAAYTPVQDNPSDQTIISTTQPGHPNITKPDFIPGYELIRELGRGGMGVVYLARQQGLNRLVAIKMVLAGKHASETDLARFKAEAGAVAQLQHPQIVQVFETGEFQGNPWFSMEYVDGGGLDKRLQGRPLAPREAARLISLLADAVSHAHSRGVLHRDLKPGNILLQSAETPTVSIDATQRNLRSPSKSNTLYLDAAPSGVESASTGGPVTLKITDFGLAKQLVEAGAPVGSRTQEGAVLGSPSYMAPEQAAGDASQLGPATDLYALGAMLYELLTGRPPFRASTAWDTILQVLHDDPVPPTRLQPRLPRDLETICLKCLAKDPKRRYASVAELEADLQHFLADEPIQARPTPWWERTWKAARRHRAISTLVVTAVLAVLVIVALVLDNNRRLQAERDLAQVAQAKAERERRNAQLRLEKSAEAVERLLINTSSEQWSRPEMRQERKKILEEVITFYQVFLDTESDDPQLRRQAAQAYYRMAGVYLLMGEVKQAEDKLARAREIQEALCMDYPESAEFKHDLVQTINFTGNAEAMRGEISMSENTYEKAVRQAETLAKAFPSNTDFQLTLVQTYLSLARFYERQKPPKAQEYGQKAFDVAKAVYEKDNKPYGAKLYYATTLQVKAQFLVNSERAAEAGPFLDELMTVLDALARMKAPSARLREQYDSLVATVRIINGYYLVRTGKQEEGEAELNRGVKLLDDLLAQRPKAFPYRALQVNALQVLGDTLGKRKAPEARVAIQRATHLQEELAKDLPDMPWIKYSSIVQRSHFLVTRARDGDLNGLEEALKEVLATPLVATAQLLDPKYNVACAYAQGANHRTDSAERERWAARAVQLLNELYQSKYFRRQQAKHLAIDPDLDPLRGREDFKAFARSVEAQPNVTATPPRPPGKPTRTVLPPAKAG